MELRMACSVKTLEGDPPSLFVYFFFAFLALGLHIGVFVLTDWLAEQKSSFGQREKRKRYHTRHMAVKSPPTANPFLFVQGTREIHCITACASAR
jgi:hypothetical protein